MKKEGEEEDELRRGRRGIIVVGMILSLLLGCNNGGEDPQKVFLKSVVSLGNEFLNIFTSFGDVFNSSLGFKKESQKSDVRDYFDKVKKTVEGTKTALEKMIADMKEKGNPNASKTEAEVNKLVKETLDKIINGANQVKEAIGNAGDPIANVAATGAGTAAGTEVDKLVNGLKAIVDIVMQGKESVDVGDNKLPVQDDGNAGAARSNSNENAGKLFARDNAGAAGSVAAKVARDAIKAVGAVTGADKGYKNKKVKKKGKVFFIKPYLVCIINLCVYIN